MDITMEQHDGIGLVNLSGMLTSDTSESARARVQSWYEQQDCPNVVFDLSRLDFMDSTGLGVLMAILKMINEKNGQMRIASMQKKPSTLLSITRAYRVLDIYDTVDAAFASFQKQADETQAE